MSTEIDTIHANNAKYLNEILGFVRTTKPRSAWDKGVKKYAIELLEETETDWLNQNAYGSYITTERLLLQGAISWESYSQGCMSLVGDDKIAQRLCSKSELKRNKNGLTSPKGIDWMLIQAKALRQAFNLIFKCASAVKWENLR